MLYHTCYELRYLNQNVDIKEVHGTLATKFLNEVEINLHGKVSSSVFMTISTQDG